MAVTFVHKESAQVKATISKAMMDQLRELAEELGQAPSTVAAIAIGDYVRAYRLKTAAQNAAFEKMADAVIQQVAGQLQLVIAPDESGSTEPLPQ
jgi:predicted transcriptional regulator